MLILTVILMPIIFGLVLPFIKLKKVPRNIFFIPRINRPISN